MRVNGPMSWPHSGITTIYGYQAITNKQCQLLQIVFIFLDRGSMSLELWM